MSAAKVFCIAPWVHACVKPNGAMATCCERNETSEFNFTEFDQWVNSKFMIDTRLAILNGQIASGCEKCFNDDKLGKTSLRETYNKDFSKYGKISEKVNKDGTLDKKHISTFDFKLGNLCNLKCVMCAPLSSSQLQTEYKLNKPKFDSVAAYIPIGVSGNYSWPKSDEFVSFVNKISNQIKYIKFTGGEPAMNPYLLSLVNTIPDSNDITMSIVTNGTIINPELISALTASARAIVVISLEGIKSHNDEIRYLSKWDQVEQNIKELSSIPGVHTVINYQLQCFSPATFIPLAIWAEKQGIRLIVNELSDPRYLSIDSIPPIRMQQFVAELKLLNLTSKSDAITVVLNAISESYHFDPALQSQCHQYLTMLDEIRATSLMSIIA